MYRDSFDVLAQPTRFGDLASLLGSAGEAVAYMDNNWVVHYCNDVYLDNVALTATDVVGKTPFDYIPNFKRSIFYESIELCRRESTPMCRIGYSTILDRWLMVRVFPVAGGMLLLANDASDTVVKQYQLAQQALKDPLTGLPNKLRLLQDVEALLPRNQPFSVSIIALERFSAVTDILGYAGGDLALLEVASRIQSATDAGETLYKLPGEEFALLSKHGLDGTHRLQSLIGSIATPFVIQNHPFVIGAHVGCVLSDLTTKDAEQTLKRAALALRQAAQSGKGSVVFYEPILESASVLRQQLESELRAALRDGQLTLFLQPKGMVTEGSLVGAEALIRWPHPKRGTVSPGDFLPLAQECGLMPEIDTFVLGQALKMIKAMQADVGCVPVSINLSVESLADERLVDRVREALRRSGAKPSLLEIEIPEGALMRNVDTSARVLAGLHELGIKLSIDDFGTGYSSFAYLARFPVHTLKIDRSFISGMSENATNAKIVKGIVRLAHSLQLTVVAEGAETHEEIEHLRRLHCDVVQGYAFGRPMPFDDFLEFARAKLTEPMMSALTI
jgi:diguanylate cyclase (GGDEF)-like protein